MKIKHSESFWQQFRNDIIGDRAVVVFLLIIALLFVTGAVPGLFEYAP